MERRWGVTGAVAALLTLGAAAGCEKGPVEPTLEPQETVIGEAALDVATADVTQWEDTGVWGSGGQGNGRGDHGTGRGAGGNGMGRGGHGTGYGNRGQGTGPGNGGHGVGVDSSRAEVHVALAGSAVALASDLLQDVSPTDAQLALLEEATRLADGAAAALEAGSIGEAMRLSRPAVWSALKAVVLPDGVTLDEAEALLTLAEDLLASATERVGDDADDTEAWLLLQAGHLLERGARMVEAGLAQAVAPLWRSAVASTYLIGLD